MRSSLVAVAVAVAIGSWAGVALAQQAPGKLTGIDDKAMDRSVAPGDDFFSYANGAWVKRTEIPPDRAGWGAFAELAEITVSRTRTLLEEANNLEPGTPGRKAADFYFAYLDERSLMKKDISILKPLLSRIDGIKDRTALARVLGEELRADVDPLNNGNFATTNLFGLWVGPDFNVKGKYTPYLLAGGLGLPDRAYYLDDSQRMKDIRAKYQAHIANVLRLANVEGGAEMAPRIVALETKMAKVHVAREESSDVRKANNPWKRAELATRAPGLDWATYLRAAGLDKEPTLIIWHPRATKGLSALVASEPLSTWKEWLTFHDIDRRSDVISIAFDTEAFAFYGSVLVGTVQNQDRWKRAVQKTNVMLPDAVGELYVKKLFPPESKAILQQMVKNIILAFEARVDKLDWMAPATKAKAKEKLGTLYVGIGYPEKWIDYAALQIAPDDPLGNLEHVEAFEMKRALARLGRPVDMSEWCMAPQTVNAVNLPLQNALNFPAAILQAPFFDPSAPAAVNYGAIGAVIGHEISHSFDDQGAQFDAQGRLVDWWTKADKQHFEAAGGQLVEQYNAYKPFPDVHVNGKLTLSENIADLAGLAATHDAWIASLRGKTPTPAAEQQFFLAYAQAWRAKFREAAARQRIIVDGHAPPQYRADTVRNLDAWYPAFDVKTGQKLFLDEKSRVRVW